MSQRITLFALNNPKTIYALVLVCVISCAAMVPFLDIDTDPESMLSADNPARVYHNQVKAEFSMLDMIVVGIVNETQGIFNTDSLQ